jgi:DNA-binding MarR family transcriptional regulator
LGLNVIRLNSELVQSGDRFTKDLKLTSARWQILRAIGNDALTASQIARKMSLYRQTVQPLVDALAKNGLVELLPNPDHQRAKLIRTTPAGRAAYTKAMNRQVERSNRITAGLSADALTQANSIIGELVRRFEEDRRDA